MRAPFFTRRPDFHVAKRYADALVAGAVALADVVALYFLLALAAF